MMRDTDVDKISKYFDKIVMGKNSANDDGSKLAHSNKKMSGVHWTAQDSKARSNELVSMNEAHTLHFNIESIGDKLDFGNMLLRVALIGMMSLRHIILSCGSIDGLAAKTVLDNVLCSMASLKSLHLRINYFGASSSEPLNTALLAMDDLSILNINCLDVGPHFVNKLVLTLVKLTSLHTLEISCNYIEATGVKALCNILGEMTHLTTLDLSDNTFLSTGTLFLAPQLNKLSTLDILDLSKNNLGDDGCITLFNNITGMEALEELYLSDNSILDLGSAAIGTNIPKLLYLSTLDLSGNRINMKCLGRGCQECQFLISLDISDNFIEDDGLQDFCKYLPNFELLQSLSLNSNHIRSDGVKYLRTALRKKRDPIGYLSFKNNRIDIEHYNEFMEEMIEFNKKTTAYNIRKLFDHWSRGILRAEKKRIQLLESLSSDKRGKIKAREPHNYDQDDSPIPIRKPYVYQGNIQAVLDKNLEYNTTI